MIKALKYSIYTFQGTSAERLTEEVEQVYETSDEYISHKK